ncbi:uncharacterized protein SPSK_09114 [Sporothrix schenckii 1099-18]|nr:uncharacterized protein SPSK_09114 [Sporothrix schenckii 1099-18]KJR84142.1 hypothetical protein SPSK_09114 [Sporothrix schenckii 1099-18]
MDLTQLAVDAAADMKGLVSLYSTNAAATAVVFLVLAYVVLTFHKRIVRPTKPTKTTSSSQKSTADPDGLAYFLPPSRRQVLPPPFGTVEKDSVKEGEGGFVSPTGIRLCELRRLVGSFPDYAVLSGVPHPQPCPAGFTLETARFRPFRPFRWRYHQHMALMKLDPDNWLELQHSYKASLAERRALYEAHGEKILFCSTPGDDNDNDSVVDALACRELLEMALQFVCRRYPHLFALDEQEGEKQTVRVFVNEVLGTKVVLDDGVYGHRALQVLLDNIPEDFAIVTRSADDGRYRLRAASVSSSVGWCIGQHRGRPLQDIHGRVTDYATKMARSMDRYFAKLPTDQPIQRGSWTIEEGRPLFVEHEADRPGLGSEGDGDGDGGRSGRLPLHLRCDWQTLRRLPLTGAIVFNFKPAFTPLTDLRSEPYVPALLHQILDQGDPRLVTPGKCMEHTHKEVVSLLKSWADEQVASGVVPADWEPRTLDESPFYPGWEAVWHGAQGF